MHKEALQWITGLLNDRQIPFLICGGLAAIGYGSTRALNDIDLFVPDEYFDEVVKAGEDYLSKPAKRYCEQGWDLEYVQFIYAGVKIEIGRAEGVRILDAKSREWVSLAVDFSRMQLGTVLDIEVPLMMRDDLLRYKAVLGRPVDLQDIEAIKASSLKTTN
ncbi:MAG: hypothetical protein MI754_16865 [Chromatiales bacterium]|nr:hypothetical protein [Chromatiales bacterium]